MTLKVTSPISHLALIINGLEKNKAMRDLMEDFSIVFTIISITIILYFVFFGVWGHLEEKKAAKEKRDGGEISPILKKR